MAARAILTWSTNRSVVDDPAPMKPSPSRTDRRTASGWLAPNHTGGYGRCTGFGSIGASLSCQNWPSKVTDGSVHSRFIRSRPSVNRVTRWSGLESNAANGRNLPPVPTPTSIRPPLSWSSEMMLLARCTGLRSGVTKTAQPSRIRSVQAAAYAISSSGLITGLLPMICSWVQAPSKPSSSARTRNRRTSRGSTANCGMATAKRMGLPLDWLSAEPHRPAVSQFYRLMAVLAHELRVQHLAAAVLPHRRRRPRGDVLVAPFHQRQQHLVQAPTGLGGHALVARRVQL